MTKRQQLNLSQSRDGGYTIIESLVAMIVVSVLMIAIAPVMAFSVATRVQARRTELATQAARTYIDALRTGAIASPTPGPAGRGFPIKVSTGNVADAPVPTASDKSQNLYPLDMDGGGFSDTSSTDFYVQGAWRNPSDPPDPTKTGYELIVRVYRADSFANGVTLRPPKDAKQSVVGSGLGDKTIPVVEMTTQIPRTTGEASAYESLCARLKGTNGCK
ncbi:hormogonium polysaccharide secretion pseudopilin HpsB [Microcoleus sp. Pol11C2]|uniref:hormogonium polysaccharide secretion pseudopilin HpsB n=1 Tax=Microcoleus sp. Pol11C2 TaxID=3055389 RepID=UPI002FD2EE2D